MTESSTIGHLVDHTEPRERINHLLASFLDQAGTQFREQEPITEVFLKVQDFVLSKGKRLRPLFCYWGWRGAEDQRTDAVEQAVIRAAASLEIFHAFALIHDDIMDSSDTRRGRPTLHRELADLHLRTQWPGVPEHAGLALAILAGDLCLVWSDALVDSCVIPIDRWRRARDLLHQTRTELVLGQYLDLLGHGGGVREALRVIQLKSGRYTVERPLHLGAVLAGASPAVLRAYSDFALPLGEAFQLRDDILGVFGDPATTGKSTTGDLREGKPTVLIALARQQASPTQAEELEMLYGNPGLDADGAATLREIITDCGARAMVETMITQRTDRALTALHTAPITADARVQLRAMAHAATTRTQ